MGTNFDVTAILKANVSDFSSGMKEAQASLQSLKHQTGSSLDKVSNSLSAVGASAIKLGSGMTATLTAPVVAGVTGIVKSFADLEQNLGGTEVVFGNFAKTVQNNAQTAYKNMGLSASDYMATANKMASLFQGSGISQQKSLDLTSQAMQRAADVASVMGIDTSMAMESIAGAAKGNFTMMDNLGVAMNATTLEAYALEKGLNFKWETASNAEKAELAMQMFMDRTKQFDGNFLKESEKTVSGSLSAMKSAFQNFVAGLGNPEADIKQLMANLKTTIENFAKNVKTVIGTIWDNLPLAPWQKWLGLIAVSAGPALIAIGGVISVISKLVGTISFIAGAVSKVSAWFTLLNSGGSALSVTFAKIVGVVSSLGAPFLVVIAVIASLIAILVGVYNTSEEFRNKVNSAFEAVRTTVMSAIQEVVSFVMEIFGTLISWWNENHALFEQTATTVWNAIKSVVETVTNFLAPFIEATWNNIVSVVSAAWDILKVVIETTLNIILGIIKVVMQLINGDWSGAWETIKETAGKVWDGIKKIIDTAINSVWNVIQTGWEGIKNVVSATLEFIKSLIQSGWNRILNIITSIGSFIVSAVKTAFNNAVASARNFISNAYNVGRNLILGFVNGVKNAAGALINAVGGAVQGAIDWAKGLLGIHSPSRVFRQFGEYTDEGFIIGVNNRAGAVMKTVGNMAQGAIDAFSGKDLAGNLQSELGAVDGELGRLTGYDTSVDFNGGTITVGQQSADIVLKMGNTTYRAFTEDITSAQEMELTLASY
nr:MAG TPA: tail tape measure protein [Bacteriophage sp.]